MSYNLNKHCIGALSFHFFVRLSVSQSNGPSIGPFVSPSTVKMHHFFPVRLVLMPSNHFREKQVTLSYLDASVVLSACPSIHPSVRLSVQTSFHHFVRPSVRPFVHPPVRL